MPITMRDVAQAAGVSIKTVSRVVNQQGEISEETQQRVQAVIDRLGYRPNRLAQGLVSSRSHSIGLVGAYTTNPYVADVAHSISETARTKGYNMFFCTCHDDPKDELDLLHSLAMQGVDGIILFPSNQTDASLAENAPPGCPLVILDWLYEHPGVATIRVDLQRGACLAVEHLIARGHRAIGMLSDPILSPFRGRRRRGFLETLALHGLPAESAPIVYVPSTAEGGYSGAQQLLEQSPGITAIVAQNDMMAFGAIRACVRTGRRIPQDCAVVGFDDLYLASIFSPALTTVRIDRHLLGKLAAERLLGMIDDPQPLYAPMQLGVELIVREST